MIQDESTYQEWNRPLGRPWGGIFTPDADRWDPNDATFAAEEDAFLGADGDIDLRDPLPQKELIGDGDLLALYADPISIADFELWCDKVAQVLSMSMAIVMPDRETINLN